MSDNYKTLREYKLVDFFESNGVSVRVFVCTRKEEKQYFRDIEYWFLGKHIP